MSDEKRELFEKLDSLAKKIDVLTTVTAAGAFQGKQLTESIAVLLSLGLEPSEIARILGTKPNIVRAIKSQITKKTKEKKQKPQTKEG
jgi:regulator of replication initiation timing